VVGYWVLTPSEYSQLSSQIISGSLFVENYFLYKEIGYFDTPANAKPLLHLWSLGIEEQFYIFWPLILVTLLKFKEKLPKLILVLIICSFLWSIFVLYAEHNPSKSFFFLSTRAWELMIGH